MSLGSLGQLRASTQSSRSCVTTVIWVSWLAQVGPFWNPVKSAGGQPPMTHAAVKHPPGYAVIPNRPDTTVNVSAGLHRTVNFLPSKFSSPPAGPLRPRGPCLRKTPNPPWLALTVTTATHVSRVLARIFVIKSNLAFSVDFQDFGFDFRKQTGDT